MACTPIVINPGPFDVQSPTTTNNATFGAGTSKLTLTVDNTTLYQVNISSSGGGSQSVSFGPGGSYRYYQVGDSAKPSVLVIAVKAVDQCYATLVHWVGTTLHATGLWGPSNVSGSGGAPVVVHTSTGNAAAFLLVSSNGTQYVQLGIWRSDNAAILCSATPQPVSSTLKGNATADKVQILAGATVIGSGNIPKGHVELISAAPHFSAAIGGCSSYATDTKTVTVKNTGSDCVSLNSVSSAAPFAVTATVPALPTTLGAGDSATVTIRYSPTTTGSSNNIKLLLDQTPAVNPQESILCSGTATAATAGITTAPAVVDFGDVPVSAGPKTIQLKITNSKQKPLTLTVSSSSNPVFTWSAITFDLGCGDTQPINITFDPIQEGPVSTVLTVSGGALAAAVHVTVKGEGCVPRAGIDADTSPIDFGDIEHGYRAVREIFVHNPGNGQLTFTATMASSSATATFGLEEAGSITNVVQTESFEVDAVHTCGGSDGTGVIPLGVAFFANGPDNTTITGTLTIDNHNATQGSPATQYVIPLTARIVPKIPIDLVLVGDHSGSMNDVLPGGEKKVDDLARAGRLLAEIMQPDVGDRFGLVRFNQAADVSSAITEVTAANQSVIANLINNTTFNPTGSTSIAAGVDAGVDQLRVPRVTVPPEIRRAMVVLTDGLDNTAYAKGGNFYTVLGGPLGFGINAQPLPLPDPAEMRIYGVGFGKGPGVGTQALDALAAGTGGYYGVVGLDTDALFNLQKYFTQIYLDLVTTPTVVDPAWWIQPGQKLQVPFNVLRGDVEAMVVIYDLQGLRLPVQLRSPTGEIIDPALVPPGYQLRSGFTDTARFIGLKFPIDQPDRFGGTWNVIVEHAGRVCRGHPDPKNGPGFLPKDCARSESPVRFGLAIGVGSNLRMFPFVTPAPVSIGEPIQISAVMSEGGAPCLHCNVRVRITSPSGMVRQVALADGGAHGDGGADDGEYGFLFTQTNEPGTYEFAFDAIGKSRDRELVRRQATLAKYVDRRKRHEPHHVLVELAAIRDRLEQFIAQAKPPK